MHHLMNRVCEDLVPLPLLKHFLCKSQYFNYYLYGKYYSCYYLLLLLLLLQQLILLILLNRTAATVLTNYSLCGTYNYLTPFPLPLSVLTTPYSITSLTTNIAFKCNMATCPDFMTCFNIPVRMTYPLLGCVDKENTGVSSKHSVATVIKGHSGKQQRTTEAFRENSQPPPTSTSL